jgi:predicted nucleotidyltransferase
MAATLDLLRKLVEQNVEFVLVGGLAATFHGARRITEDLDVCVPFTLENVKKVLASLAGVNPRYRERPDLPFKTDPAYYVGFKNLYLMTDAGQLDLMGEIGGIGGYTEALKESIEIDAVGSKVRLLSLAALIKGKRAVARRKDLEALRELEAIQKRLEEGK